MADLQKTIEIIFKGTNQLSGTIGTVGSELESFGSSVTAIGAPLDAAAGWRGHLQIWPANDGLCR